tara:strand:+ start:547 stop:1221 length:675 start_codon:yes stop_codon:yes gene_type:complete
MVKNISNLGDAALYCNFGNEVNKEINLKVINYFKNLINSKIEGITNIAPSYNKIIVTFDLSITDFAKIKDKIQNIKLKNFEDEKNKKIKIPVCCDKKFVLDLNRLEEKLNISGKQILDNFFENEYFCYMTGFIAGMPFLGDINKKLRANRLETPRVRVPKGSIGLTEQFCNIYTFESPGGWNIIGNTPVKVFDKSNTLQPALINPGDTVNFFQIKKEEYDKWNE